MVELHIDCVYVYVRSVTVKERMNIWRCTGIRVFIRFYKVLCAVQQHRTLSGIVRLVDMWIVPSMLL